MRKRREETSNWLLTVFLLLLTAASILYLGLYYWPHSQGRPSPLDKYAPLARGILDKMGLAPKKQGIVGSEKDEEGAKPISADAIRHEIVQSAEWINTDEIAAIETTARTATVTVRAKMTNQEALAATREIFMIVFRGVPEVSALRVVMRVKARAAPGRIIDVLRSDISMTRSTYKKINWARLTPRALPKAADEAKLYFRLGT